MKPLTRGASWKPSDAANVKKNCRCLRSTNAPAQSRTTRLARCANAQWQKTGTSATRTKQQPRSRSGGNRIAMPSSSTGPTTGRSTTGKNLAGNTALSHLGLTSSYSAKEMRACAASANSSGATSKPRRMSITATTPKLFAEFSATDATPFLACAKTTTSCFRLWRGI